MEQGTTSGCDIISFSVNTVTHNQDNEDPDSSVWILCVLSDKCVVVCIDPESALILLSVC